MNRFITFIPFAMVLTVFSAHSSAGPAAPSSCSSQLLSHHQDAIRTYSSILENDLSPDEEKIELIERLLAHHPGAKKAIPIDGLPGSFLTFSFEKETHSNLIAALYRPLRIPEKQWLEMPDEERKAALVHDETRFAPENRTSTSLLPDYLGQLTYENSSVLEVKHANFEFEPKRLIQEVREIAAYLGETHSFHAHIGFEVGEQDSKKLLFHWFKILNDHLVIAGMTEGLFPNNMTRIMKDSWGNTYWSEEKLLSAGIRQRIYGVASTSDRKKWGCELRDSTRNLNTLEKRILQIAQTQKTRAWAKLLVTDSEKARMVLIPTETQGPATWGNLDLASRYDPLAGLPYLKFENGLYPDYQNLRLFSPTEEQIKKIQAARITYEKNSQDLIRELNASEIEPMQEDIQTVIHWNLQQWARESGVADLYGKY
ncbi:MAG: hypothetical protein JNL01_01260 [Bdellovibrionales bacterium]|nr:hypothetical protein [Bdellovibrionales bacterium]